MQAQIEQAMKVTRSNRAAAEYLRVGYNLYKRFAKAYKDPTTGRTLFDMHYNKSGKGIVKATKKQFDNDAKKIEESRQARQALMAQIANSR